MKDFINLLELFIEKRIDFQEFDSNWQKMYLEAVDSKLYESFSDLERDFLDEIHDKEDMVAYKKEEVEELKQYKFVSVDEFINWLKELKEKNIQIWK